MLSLFPAPPPPQLVLGAVDFASLAGYEQVDYMPFDPVLKRTEGTLREPATGALFKTTKGAPHVIAQLVAGPGSDETRATVDAVVDGFAERGVRSLAVARTVNAPGEPDAWRMCGILTFLDPPRPDTKATLHTAMMLGIDVKSARPRRADLCPVLPAGTAGSWAGWGGTGGRRTERCPSPTRLIHRPACSPCASPAPDAPSPCLLPLPARCPFLPPRQ